MGFQIYAIERDYGSQLKLKCVSANVIKETPFFWMLEKVGAMGAFGYRERVPKGSYALSEADAWRNYAAQEAAQVDRLRGEAERREALRLLAIWELERLPA